MKKYKLFSVIVILALLFAVIPLMSVGAATCTTTLSPGDDIQTAIDFATVGDVICLEPGIYSPPAKININKTVTLQGPQAGVDPRPSAGTSRVAGDSSTEAIIDGAAGGLSGIIVITADNVVLDGLEIRNGSGDLVDSESSLPVSGVVLKHNIIDGASGDEALQIRACTDCVIEFNHIFNIAQDGINMCCGSTGGTIQFNEVHDNYSENAAIYMYDADYMTVQCNLVYDVFGNDGIKMGTKGGGDAALSGGSILYNTVHDTVQDGITVYTSDVTVEGNEVSYSTSENGAIYVAYAVSNITMENNYIHDNTLQDFKWGNPGGILIGADVDVGTVYINNNNIVNNSVNGVTNNAAALLYANSNWWGAADGPSGEGSGTGDAVSTNVDFDPWLTEAVFISNPCVLDDEGPITTNVVADPNPAAVGSSVMVTANVDDTTTGGSNIAYANYELLNSDDVVVDSGSMSAVDSSFDSPIEDVTTTITVPATPGIYDLCVFGTDAPGNVGASECIMLVVYDPDGGFVTGGGWITSPEGAMPPTVTNVTISGISGDTSTDPGATNAPYYLRYVGNPPPAGYDPSHNYQWGSPAVFTPSPEDGPVTLTGTIEVGDQTVGQVAMIGLLDKADLAAGNSNGQRGAYIYIYRNTATSWKIGPSDGNVGGEIIQTAITVSDTDLPADGVLNVVFTVDGTADGLTCASGPATAPAGCLTLQITGGSVNATLTDSYGDALGTSGDSAVPEFAEGAVPGWFDYVGSNVGYTLTLPSLTSGSPEGKATFGFVSKYKKGAEVPTGNTEFQFKAGNLNFHSTSYDWLVVTGSDYAKFKGTGTINGEGEYKFMLWAGDDDPDTFRIKIWYEDGGSEVVVYDNGMDQAIGGGSIVVHKK